MIYLPWIRHWKSKILICFLWGLRYNKDMLCPSHTVPNLLPNVEELTILSCSVGGSFLVILGMTMTMTINSNNVRLICVTLQASTKVLNMFKTSVFAIRVLFIPGYTHWKSVVFFFVAQPTCCILVVLIIVLLYSGCSNCILHHLYM